MGKKSTKIDNASLTDRETEIIKYIIEEELSNKEIAKILNLSNSTIETHRKNIYKKTKAKSIVALVKYAHHNRIVRLT